MGLGAIGMMEQTTITPKTCFDCRWFERARIVQDRYFGTRDIGPYCNRFDRPVRPDEAGRCNLYLTKLFRTKK